jgi:3(or 17)beta-hydroxysteroid dehydrogenase
MTRLEGKTILITGAASGLGAAAARRLHREGAFVVVTDRNVAAGSNVAAELGDRGLFRELNVTEETAWIAVIDEVIAARGRLDGLVNNAGIGRSGSIEEATLEDWRLTHAVNVEGVFFGCKHAVRVMKERGGGSIVNVSSIAALIGAPGLCAYASSKGAVRSLTKSVAMHCAQRGYGIRCNSIHPVFIETPMLEAMVRESADPERMRRGLEKSVPLGRIGAPEDVAAAIAYLVSEDARFLTGIELPIDGGFMAQ